jgi:hypothetical protein
MITAIDTNHCDTSILFVYDLLTNSVKVTSLSQKTHKKAASFQQDINISAKKVIFNISLDNVRNKIYISLKKLYESKDIVATLLSLTCHI